MKRITHIITIAFLIQLLMSCSDTQKQLYSHQTTIETKIVTYTNDNHPGKKLMETLCYACHNPTASHDARIAPPMVAVKSHYLDDNMTKQEFAASIWNFVKKPSKENTKMRGAVRRFGVMPYQEFSKEDIELISNYIYDFKIEEPAWFKEHIQEKGHGKMKYRNDANQG
ncbi:cytochrome c [Kordia periserrulae]|uniref:Cytochrome c n=1 Tax=Kordia periserrulae TaxID=701523 RepID=A0A2T6BUN3_9FLAO|nr:c-type cytochrome [Kordia periserrulae]PTX59762.1 cytochrome c [Kordia periserrulae]